MDSKRPFLILFLLLMMGVFFGCQPDELGSREGDSEKSVSESMGNGGSQTNANKGEGFSRTRPFPPNTLVQTTNWEVEILDYQRGQVAWEMLEEQSSSNKPPNPGEEYVLVQYRVQYNGTETADDEPLHLHLTGNRAVKYYSFEADLYPPDYLYTREMVPGDSVTGWVGYRIHADESDLMVIAAELFTNDDTVRYMALDSRASVSAPLAELEAIEPTDNGRSPDDPVLVGQTATTEDWQITINEVIIGEDAWPMLVEANRLNDPPEKGMQYILVNLTVRYIGLTDQGENVDAFDFDMLDPEGERYQIPAIVDPHPAFGYVLYPGGEGSGWATYQAAITNPELTLMFNPDFDRDSPNKRYFSLLQVGR